MKRFRLSLLALLLPAALSLPARADEAFDFEVLRYQAKMLASKPYAPHPVDVPEALLKLTYDQYRDIRF